MNREPETYTRSTPEFNQFSNSFVDSLPEMYLEYSAQSEADDQAREEVTPSHCMCLTPMSVRALLRFQHEFYSEYWKTIGDSVYFVPDASSMNTTVPYVGGIIYFSSSNALRNAEGEDFNRSEVKDLATLAAVKTITDEEAILLFGDAQARDRIVEMFEMYVEKRGGILADKYIPDDQARRDLKRLYLLNYELAKLMGYYFSQGEAGERYAHAQIEALQNSLTTAYAVLVFYIEEDPEEDVLNN